MNRIFKGAGKKECSDVGQLAVLILLMTGLYKKENNFLTIAAVALGINLIVPVVFYPLAVIWFAAGRLLGMVAQPVIFGFLFLFLITPAGLFRRMIGKDRLKLKVFKKGKGSVMVERNHLYKSSDLENTY